MKDKTKFNMLLSYKKFSLAELEATHLNRL
jgi:hypothetical protein